MSTTVENVPVDMDQDGGKKMENENSSFIVVGFMTLTYSLHCASKTIIVF